MPALDPDVLAFIHAHPLDLTGPNDQDWIKKGTWDLPDTPDELRAHLVAIGMTVAQFKRLPVYRWHLEDRPWLAQL